MTTMRTTLLATAALLCLAPAYGQFPFGMNGGGNPGQGRPGQGGPGFPGGQNFGGFGGQNFGGFGGGFGGGAVNSEPAVEIDYATVKTGLPAVYITTPASNSITSKEVWTEGCTLRIVDKDGTTLFDSQTMEKEEDRAISVKGRGNSTWDYAQKKPYTLKLGNNESLLGMPESKRWNLLADFYDPSHVRNALTMWMGETFTELGWTPKMRSVDLILNGKYHGTYWLSETIQLKDNKVPDGTIVEIDGKAGAEETLFYSKRTNLPFNIKDPDLAPDAAERAEVKKRVDAFEDVLYGPDFLDPEKGYKKLIDLESFADWLVINEIAQNHDSKFYTSVYFNLKADGILAMGPLWDYDLALGNAVMGNMTSFGGSDVLFMRDAPWFTRMYQDPEFVALVKKKFSAIHAAKQKILDFVDQTAADVKGSVEHDRKMWTSGGGMMGRQSMFGRPGAASSTESTYETEISTLKSWVSNRLDTLNQAINRL